MRKIWMELGTGKKTSIDYFLPLLNPDQTSEERTFEEDIEMRADDVNEGFEDEERGQLRKSRVEENNQLTFFACAQLHPYFAHFWIRFSGSPKIIIHGLHIFVHVMNYSIVYVRML